LFAVAVALSSLAGNLRAADSAAKLVDSVIIEPGRWDQMCSMPMSQPFDFPLPLYTAGVRRVHTISDENVKRLKEQRADVVAELAHRLDTIDLSRPSSTVTNGEFSFKGSNLDPKALTGILLDMVLELDAVETLPGLMHLEEELNHRLENVQKDGGA